MIFDFIIALGVIPIGFLPEDFRGIYFVWFSIFVLLTSFVLKPRREFNNKWLFYILIWAFLNVFAHSFLIKTDSALFKWVNYGLMNEGFMYIFFGALLFKVIVEYSYNLRLLYLTLPIAAFPWAKFMLYHGQASVVFSVALAGLIYLMMKKQYKVVITLLSVIAIIVVINLKWLLMKWMARPFIWMELLRQIKEHPFMGWGFNHYLTPDNMLYIQIKKISYGWLWKHNDYFSLGAFLGLPILIPLWMFIKGLCERFQKTNFIIPFMATLILMFFQMTMFTADKALIIITSTALFYTKTGGVA